MLQRMRHMGLLLQVPGGEVIPMIMLSPFGVRSGPETKNANDMTLNVLLEPIFREKPYCC